MTTWLTLRVKKSIDLSMTVLGIETSCDECSAAVVRDGRDILSNVIATQIELHKPYQGVVPELASRLHTETSTLSPYPTGPVCWDLFSSV